MKQTELERLARTFQEFGRTWEQCLQIAQDEINRRDSEYIEQNARDIDEIFKPVK